MSKTLSLQTFLSDVSQFDALAVPVDLKKKITNEYASIYRAEAF